MGLIDDYNGIQVEQSPDFDSITAAKYVNRVLKTHAGDQAMCIWITNMESFAPSQISVSGDPMTNEGFLQAPASHHPLQMIVSGLIKNYFLEC